VDDIATLRRALAEGVGDFPEAIHRLVAAHAGPVLQSGPK